MSIQQIVEGQHHTWPKTQKKTALLKKPKEKHNINAFFYQNTCTIQKKAVPLHRNSEEKPSIKDVS
jgi:hypothetical protein